MRAHLLVLIIFIFSSALQAQQVVNLEENKSYSYNGLDYSFYISNEKSKEVKGEDYERYELNLTVTNNSGCLKLIPFRPNWNTGSSNNDEDKILVAEFNCTNATGKRLTAKKGLVNAKPWFNNVRIQDDSAKTKYRMVSAQVGFALRNGETITTRIIVIVPKGERPVVNCRAVQLPEA